MKYSIVMPCYLREDAHKQTVINTLESLKSHSQDFELIIVDDGSTEPTGFLRQYADVYVRQPNSGISRAWNVGMLLAQGEYVAIVNDDILITDGWLDVLTLPFADDMCGVSAPEAGGPGVVPELTLTTIKENHKFYPGYCFMFKRDKWYEYFDNQFKTNCGDCDMWSRIRQAGLECMRAPLKVWHKEGGTLHNFPEGYKELSDRSIEQFEAKWGFNPQREYYQW